MLFSAVHDTPRTGGLHVHLHDTPRRSPPQKKHPPLQYRAPGAKKVARGEKSNRIRSWRTPRYHIVKQSRKGTRIRSGNGSSLPVSMAEAHPGEEVYSVCITTGNQRAIVTKRRDGRFLCDHCTRSVPFNVSCFFLWQLLYKNDGVGEGAEGRAYGCY